MLISMSNLNFMLSLVEHEKSSVTSGIQFFTFTKFTVCFDSHSQDVFFYNIFNDLFLYLYV